MQFIFICIMTLAHRPLNAKTILSFLTKLYVVAFDLLLGIDFILEWIEGNLLFVKSMHMFIHRTPAAIFACTFVKTLLTSTTTPNWTLMTSISSIEK